MARKVPKVSVPLDACVHAPNPMAKSNRYIRMMDLNMGAAFNARERTVSEWKTLLAEADARLILKSVVEPPGSALGILEVIWMESGTV